jgi:hypothetical protein
VAPARWTLETVLGAVVLATSCAGSDPTRGVPDAGGKTFARVGLVLTTAHGEVTVGAVGRLLRYHGLDRDSAQVLAGALDREATTLGRCALVDDDARIDDALATAPPDAAVQLLDAGDLLVRVAGQTVKLVPRYVPEIVPFVTGVVYSSEIQADGADLGGGAAFISAFGGREIGRFVSQADVPAAPHLLGDGGSVDAGADLAVSWTADAAAPHGTVSIVVARENGPALRCHVADTGRFTISGAALTRVVDAARGEAIGLSVERSKKTTFSAPGLDAAEVEVTVRDLITLHVG